MPRPVARALFLLSSITLALFFVILMMGGLGQLTVVAEGTGRSPSLSAGPFTPRAPFTFTALHNDFYLGGGQIIAVTDLNGDGYPDLVRSGVFSDQTSIWFNDGTGNYYDSQQYFAGFEATSVGDVNFDSLPDLVGLFSEPVSANPIFGSLINDGQGLFRDYPAHKYIYFRDGPSNRQNMGQAIFLDGDQRPYQDLLIQLQDTQQTGFFRNSGWEFIQIARIWPYQSVPVDINGDGSDDAWEPQGVITPSRLWLNSGTGGVTLLAQTLPAGNHLTAADFNGDTFLDLYIHDILTGQIAFGDGTGVFTTNGQLITGLQMGLADHGDFDGDGDQDLAIPNTDIGDVTIWENDGTGLLTATWSLPAGPATQATVADLDLDGRDDIVLSLLEGETGQAVWLNNSVTTPPAGLQLATTGPQTGENCIWHFSSLSSGNNLDTTWHFSDGGTATGATARHCYDSAGSQQAWFTATNALGTITDTIVYTIPTTLSPSAQLHISGSYRLLQPFQIDVLTHTGHLGAMQFGDGLSGWSPTASYSHVYTQPGTYEISLNLAPPGQPPFLVTETITLNPSFVASHQDLWLNAGVIASVVQVFPADFDNDGAIDILVTGDSFSSHLMKGDGTGRFTFHQQYLNTDDVTFADVGDLNADGFLDIISTGMFEPGFGGQGRVFINDGSGFFYAGQQNIFSGEDASLVKLADFDGDNDLDAFVGYSATNSVDQIFWNDGSGHFNTTGTNFAIGPTRDIAVVDLNGDTHLDIVLARYSQGTEIWFNDGQGSFSRSTQILNASLSVASGDLNGDDIPDLVMAADPNSALEFAVWLNDGLGNFTLVDYPAPGQPFVPDRGFWQIPYREEIALGDIDQDGDLDLVLASGLWMLFLNDGTGHFTLSEYRYTRVPTDVALADLDDDDDLDFVLGIVTLDPFDWEESPYPVQPIWLNNNALEPITGVSVSNTGPVNAGNHVQLLTNVATGNEISISWDLGNGQADTRQNPFVIYHVPGNYTATLTISNPLSIITRETVIQVTDSVNMTPSVNHSAYAPPRVPITFTLEQSHTLGTLLEFGDGDHAIFYRDLETLLHVYSQTGSYTVTAHDAYWRITTTTRITITDETLWGLNISVDLPAQLNQPAIFTATLAYGQPTTCTWDMGDGTILSGPVVTHTYTAYGDYTITLTVTDGLTTLQATLPVSLPPPKLFLPILVAAPPPD